MTSSTFKAALAAAAVAMAALPTTGFSQGTDMMRMMKENNDKMMSMPMSGNTDVDFAMMMREHHKGALMMAESELKDGKDAKMRDMAKKIIAAQKKEIAQFDAYLAAKGHAHGKK